MPYDASGTIHHIFDEKQVSAKLSKLEFVLEVPDGRYPQLVMFELVNDKIAALDGFREGDQVRVTFEIRGRKWDGPNGTKYFNSLNAFRIEGIGDVRSRERGSRNSREELHSSASDDNSDIPF